jgi:hypothetical protein
MVTPAMTPVFQAFGSASSGLISHERQVALIFSERSFRAARTLAALALALPKLLPVRDPVGNNLPLDPDEAGDFSSATVLFVARAME